MYVSRPNLFVYVGLIVFVRAVEFEISDSYSLFRIHSGLWWIFLSRLGCYDFKGVISDFSNCHIENTKRFVLRLIPIVVIPFMVSLRYL
jgi:hypothetical protein